MKDSFAYTTKEIGTMTNEIEPKSTQDQSISAQNYSNIGIMVEKKISTPIDKESITDF